MGGRAWLVVALVAGFAARSQAQVPPTIGCNDRSGRAVTPVQVTNGIIVSNDGRTLYVSDDGPNNWRSYPILADGTVGPGKLFFDPPADGDYQVRLTDARGQGGNNYGYRLTVRPPQPSFQVRFNPTVPVATIGDKPWACLPRIRACWSYSPKP